MNNVYQYISLICSALLLNAALFWPSHCWVALFIFLVPLIICFIKYDWRPTAIQGFIWGILFFGLHWIAIAELLIQHAQTKQGIAFGCYLFLVLYTSLYSAAWFILVTASKRVSSNYYLSMLIFILSSYLYFYTIYYHAFFIFGVHTGYSLGFILLPLMATKYGRLLFVFSGTTGAMLLIITGNVLLAHIVLVRKKIFIIGTSISIALITLASIMHKKEQNNINMSHNSFAYVKPVQEETSRSVLQKTITAIQNIKIKQPEATLIVMPETTFSFEMNHFSIKMLQENLDETTNLLFGCYYRQKNSILCVNNERIIFTYEKTTYHPFSETLYWPWNFFKEKGWLPHLFLCGKENILASDNKSNTWFIDIDNKQNLIFPAICSDLFFNTQAKINKESDYIFFICNDSWFSYHYFRNLMSLYAVYIAVENRIPIIYVSHTCAAFINAKGESSLLIQ